MAASPKAGQRFKNLSDVRRWTHYCWSGGGFLASVIARVELFAQALPRLVLFDVMCTVAAMASGAVGIYGVHALTVAGLLDKGAFTKVLAVACPLIMMVQYVSPSPVVFEAVRKHSTESLPTQVFYSQAACNILGLAYGIQIANASVLVTNMFGLACQVLFITIGQHVQSLNTTFIWYSIQMCTILNCALYFFATVARIDILGHTITLFNIILFASPLTKLRIILKTRNASSIPTAMSCISVVNNVAWSLYALMIKDMVLLLPSLFGYFLSAFQVLVILWCRGVLPFDLSFLLLPCSTEDSAREEAVSAPAAAPTKVGRAATIPATPLPTKEVAAQEMSECGEENDNLIWDGGWDEALSALPISDGDSAGGGGRSVTLGVDAGGSRC